MVSLHSCFMPHRVVSRVLCPPQIFSKLLYFEPVLGEPVFAVPQWVCFFTSLLCWRNDPKHESWLNHLCTEISLSWRAFQRWPSVAWSCCAPQNTETRKRWGPWPQTYSDYNWICSQRHSVTGGCKSIHPPWWCLFCCLTAWNMIKFDINNKRTKIFQIIEVK